MVLRSTKPNTFTFDEWWEYTTYPEHCGRTMQAVQDNYTNPITEPAAPIWYCPMCGFKKPRTNPNRS